MKKNILLIGKALGMLIAMTLVCGVLYTFVVTGLSQVLFSRQANGIELHAQGQNYGNALIGESFSDARHLWGRPTLIDAGTFTGTGTKSALLYNAKPSNLSPASMAYGRLITSRVAQIWAVSLQGDKAVPVDLVTGSGSGLDPDISPAAAYYQIPRIAHATGYSQTRIKGIIDRYTTQRLWSIFGEPHVNVLKVNLALDGKL